MTDKTPENESVNEAEEILQAALGRLESGEECIEGDDCPIHHRVDFEELDDSEEYGRIVTYVGDYCVITGDNPRLFDAVTLLRMVLGLYGESDAPELFETCVLYVGSGSAGDLNVADPEVRNTAVRYAKTYSDWGSLKTQHESVLMGLREGLLDVSKPVTGK